MIVNQRSSKYKVKNDSGAPLEEICLLSRIFDLEKESRLSDLFDLSSLQESSKFRALSRARTLSWALLDEKGAIKPDVLHSLLHAYETRGHIFTPRGAEDFADYTIRFLKALQDPEVMQGLKRIRAPLCHSWAEQLVRYTLEIPHNHSLSDREIRAALLCAGLTPLRQNVGSCFATAPAILIQQEQVSLFLNDLFQLLKWGKIKRTFGGVEYAIPLSPSTGMGDLKKKLLERAAYSPGLMSALEMRDPQQIQALLIQARGDLTVEGFIRFALLKKFSLTQEEVEKSESSSWKRFQIGNVFSSKIEEFKAAETRAQELFKAICDNPLLKAWEFTLASFSEVKMEFSKWNFYLSLGFSSEEGIGALLFREIHSKVEALNKQLKKHNQEYELAFDQVKTTETLLRNAGSEREALRLRAEYQSGTSHMHTCLDIRNALYEKGSHLATLHTFLLQQYDKLFPFYFQEIYDATMQDVQENAYEDSSAGFRLVYKQGRSDPSSWTLIKTKEQYVQTLVDFFSLVQSQIISACEWEGGEEIAELTARIIAYVRTEEFLEEAIQRMAKAYGMRLPPSFPLHLEQLEKTPWAYTSGGTMTTLLKTYYCREMEFTKEEKWVDSAENLLIFILDTLKSLPPKVTQSPSAMLMHSPSHAFSLLPALFKEGWQGNEFTYTWVRDQIVLPGKKFYSDMQLDGEESAFLFLEFCKETRLSFPSPIKGFCSIAEWRNAVAEVLPQKSLVDTLDAFLVQSLPLFYGSSWKAHAKELLGDLYNSCLDKASSPALLTARYFFTLVKELYIQAENTVCLPFNLHEKIAHRARQLHLAPPTTLLVADTNWSDNFFAFAINPGTEKLELWRFDNTLSTGFPMSQWTRFLNGQEKKLWTIFTHPHEYFSHAGL